MARKPNKPTRKTTTRKVQASENLPPPVTLPAVAVKPEVDEDPWGDDQLTHKQRLFVIAYVGPAAGNATKAARMAGYRDDNTESLRVTACRTLTKANVQRAIARLVASKLGSAEWTRAGITEIANGNMAEFSEVDEKGKVIINMERAAEGGALGLIREVKEEVLETVGSALVMKRSFKLYDRLRALEILAKMNGQLKDSLDLTSGGKPLKGYADIDDGDAKPADD